QDASTSAGAEVSFTVPEEDPAEALTAAEEAVARLQAGSVHHGTNLAKVSVVGAGMRTHTGVAAQMFGVLAAHDVNIDLVTTSEIKISVLVDRDKATEAIRAVHAGFGLEQPDSAPPTVG